MHGADTGAPRLARTGVGRGERGAVAVAAGVHVDAPAAIGLAELLRQLFRIARHQHGARRACANRATVAEVRLAVERHDDVKALRAGRLDPARQPQLVQQIAQRERCRAQRLGIVFRRIEIEDADVGVVEVGRARRPHVRRDAVLVGEPQQRSRVGRRADDAPCRPSSAPRPARSHAGNPFDDVLLDEPLVPMPAG